MQRLTRRGLSALQCRPGILLVALRIREFVYQHLYLPFDRCSDVGRYVLQHRVIIRRLAARHGTAVGVARLQYRLPLVGYILARVVWPQPVVLGPGHSAETLGERVCPARGHGAQPVGGVVSLLRIGVENVAGDLEEALADLQAGLQMVSLLVYQDVECRVLLDPR